MFRIVEITERPVRLNINGLSLAVSSSDGTVMERIPLAELDAVILAHPAVSFTGATVAELGRNRIALVCCDRTFCPTSCLIPAFVDCTIRRDVLFAQCNQPLPLMKRTWQCIVKNKITGQDRVLKTHCHSEALSQLPRQVKSGDKGNLESRAAVIYWKKLHLFPKRDRTAEDANRLLNYAYTVLFAATSRYLIAAGMEPRIGLHHSNPNNPFCLASDLMEPYRPVADECVIETLRQNHCQSDLSSENRKLLCQQLFSRRLTICQQSLTLFDAIRQTVLSYRNLFMKKGSSSLLLPEYA